MGILGGTFDRTVERVITNLLGTKMSKTIRMFYKSQKRGLDKCITKLAHMAIDFKLLKVERTSLHTIKFNLF